MQKFQKLSYHDQHSVTTQCTTAVLDQMKAFVDGNSSFLPQVCGGRGFVWCGCVYVCVSILDQMKAFVDGNSQGMWGKRVCVVWMCVCV